MGGPKRKYKRSWKNLLLNKGYQLKFTLFMVGLSAMLMGFLGWWVLDVASKATSTAINNIRGAPCKNPLADIEPVDPDMEPDRPRRTVVVETGEMHAGEPGQEDSMNLVPVDPTEDPDLAPPSGDDKNEKEPDENNTDEAPAPDGETGEDDDEPTADNTDGEVQIGGTQTVVTAPIREGPTEDEVRLTRQSYEKCIEGQKNKQLDLIGRERLIAFVLFGVGTMLCLGLFGYGIKMTHRVAGPLFKVQLYFKKLRVGKYDEVYNLRKGDQLIEFYDRFKSAHAGLRKMAETDIEEFEAMIEAAEKADLASKSPEIASLLEEMRAVLKRKEESVG